jgi:hypothetical protein
MPYVHDPGSNRQVQEELAIEQADLEQKQYACRYPRCNCFGIVCGKDEHYGTIYGCNCLSVFWGIDPQTGDRVEGCCYAPTNFFVPTTRI